MARPPRRVRARNRPCEVATGPRAARPGPARLLGALRLPQRRGLLAGRALRVLAPIQHVRFAEIERDREQQRSCPPVDGSPFERLFVTDEVPDEPDHEPEEGHGERIPRTLNRGIAEPPRPPIPQLPTSPPSCGSAGYPLNPILDQKGRPAS